MVSAGRSHFRVNDLVQLAALIERHNDAKRSTKVKHSRPVVLSK
jgi:hypothetical protein